MKAPPFSEAGQTSAACRVLALVSTPWRGSGLDDVNDVPGGTRPHIEIFMLESGGRPHPAPAIRRSPRRLYCGP